VLRIWSHRKEKNPFRTKKFVNIFSSAPATRFRGKKREIVSNMRKTLSPLLTRFFSFFNINVSIHKIPKMTARIKEKKRKLASSFASEALSHPHRMTVSSSRTQQKETAAQVK